MVNIGARGHRSIKFACQQVFGGGVGHLQRRGRAFGVVTGSLSTLAWQLRAAVSASESAAVITPPDVFSQVVLAAPMVLLFEGSLLIMFLSERKAAKLAAAESETVAASEPADSESA